MNRLIVRLTAISSMLIVVFAVWHDIRTSSSGGSEVFNKLMFVALSLLFCSAIFAARQRTIDWEAVPEKRRHLRIGKILVLVLACMVVLLAFRIF